MAKKAVCPLALFRVLTQPYACFPIFRRQSVR